MNKIEALQWQRENAIALGANAEKELTRCQDRLRRIDWLIKHAQSNQSVARPDDAPAKCSGCGEDVSTELKFSLHFVIPDWRYANLGYCPNKP